MKCMERNKKAFYYALFVESLPIRNEQGFVTGEYAVHHTDPAESSGNISAAVGETVTRLFGNDVLYDNVLVMDNDAPVLDENSILWVDIVPELDEDGKLAVNDNGDVLTPHDYIVKKVGKSLNSVSYAISKVKVK